MTGLSAREASRILARAAISAQAAEAAYLLKPAFKLELLHDYKSLPGAGATQKSRSSTRRVTIRLDRERSLLA